jgi:TatD DNase family protein
MLDAMELVDTHCHIHEISGTTDVAKKWRKAGITNVELVMKNAAAAAVTRLICVGCTPEDSELAVDFVQKRVDCWASVGIHPHEAAQYVDDQNALDRLVALAAKPKVVAVGECGLDYFYAHSPKDAQAKILRLQLELAQKYNLPMIFHVRDAFDDFWPIFDEFKNIRGVIHSFTANQAVLTEVLKRDLYVGLNGIMTFTKDAAQLAAAKAVPLDKLVLETDAPFLTPAPQRGTICEPKHVSVTAQFLTALRGESFDQLASATTQNAKRLFGIS